MSLLHFCCTRGYKLWSEDEDEQDDFSDSLPVRLVKKCFRVSDSYQGNKLLVRDSQGWIATPLMIVIAVIALTDVMFALDSIPAIFAVTKEPFLVFTANVFALLGVTFAVFCSRRYANTILLPAPGAGIHPQLHWYQDAIDGNQLGNSDTDFIVCHCTDDICCDYWVTLENSNCPRLIKGYSIINTT